MAADCGDNIENNFAFRLLELIHNLYDSSVYSDVTIVLSDSEIRAHKLVLSARSELWNESVLQSKEKLDWTDLETEVAKSMIRWIYTNELVFASDEIAVKIIRKAFEFGLKGLVEASERFLINSVTVRTCVKFYSVAEEVDAKDLREYCSGLISTHWDDLSASDFEHMSGPLLYEMLKGKTTLPLHSAVRLQRDDVVYLCLLENASRVSVTIIVNFFLSCCPWLLIRTCVCVRLPTQTVADIDPMLLNYRRFCSTYSRQKEVSQIFLFV